MTIRKYTFGDELRDKVSGFTGIVVGVTYYATGCIHYGLQAKVKKDSDVIPSWQWIDQSQLELVKALAVNFDVPKESPSGKSQNPNGYQHP